MKKLRTGFLCVAAIAGISGAIAAKVQAAPSPQAPTYNWNGSGPLKSGVDLNKTVAQAQADYGCFSTNTLCATGVPTSGMGGNVTIKKP